MRLVGGADRWFDERMALTGSSDTELFERLARDGARIVWADLAVVRGNPTRNIGDVRQVEAVFLGGRQVARGGHAHVDVGRAGHAALLVSARGGFGVRSAQATP